MAQLTGQEKQGGLKLIYIDPPFDVGADFSMDIEIPNSTPPNLPLSGEETPFPPDKGGRGGWTSLATTP